jgi:(1->4)-alpha-D-glucan 1-alpha-D-glucosylmutase
MGGGFGFAQLAEAADYLAELGISHIYLSPSLQATRATLSGYDVVDPGRVSAELGGPEGWGAMCRRLNELSLAVVLDIVPNHMGTGPENPAWNDVLEHGPASRYATFFDIDWDGPHPHLSGKLLLPILGHRYGPTLEAGDIRLEQRGGRVVVMCYDQALPASPRSLADLPADEPARQVALEAINADKRRLHEFLDKQHYRLADWRLAGREVNYRRFFEVASLAALQADRPEVFDQTHGLVLAWLRAGQVDGLRVDHVDGLRDPLAYLRRLREAAPSAWMVVEKILEPSQGERLPERWPCQGTSGYDFMWAVGGLFVDRQAEGEMTALYERFTGQHEAYEDMVHRKKLQVLREGFAGELRRLAVLLAAVADERPQWRDFADDHLLEALVETAAWLPVYRTYVTAGREPSVDDERFVLSGIEHARSHRDDLPPELWDMLAEVLLRPAGSKAAQLVARFQQLTSPAMAKGVEDSAFYCYNRLISLNEVGGDPACFGVAPHRFHEYCRDMLARWPATMTTTNTHDTKRGEDVRLRISMLSEMPGRWARMVQRFSHLARRHGAGELADRNFEYFFYQTLVGAWPIPIERLWPAMLKSAREAKDRTSWRKPHEAYERALERLVRGLVADAEFVAELEGFIAPMRLAAQVSSLSQVLLKLLSPGVPDTYWGDELWGNNLVDPDNRRPVDFAPRRALLARAKSATLEDVVADFDSGLPKLYVMHRALRVRHRLAEVFDRGGYEPLEASGPAARHIVAFMRGGAAIAVASRLVFSLGGQWGDTRLDLPPGLWRDELSGRAYHGSMPAGEAMGQLGVALLVKEGGGA